MAPRQRRCRPNIDMRLTVASVHRDGVEVGAGGGVQAQRLHGAGEHRGVDALRAPAAVFVGLNLYERRLGRAAEARAAPRNGDRPPLADTRSGGS